MQVKVIGKDTLRHLMELICGKESLIKTHQNMYGQVCIF